jgi:hypothetical protein
VEKKVEAPVTVAAVDVTVEIVLAVVAVVIIDAVLDVDLRLPEAVEATMEAVVCSSWLEETPPAVDGLAVLARGKTADGGRTEADRGSSPADRGWIEVDVGIRKSSSGDNEKRRAESGVRAGVAPRRGVSVVRRLGLAWFEAAASGGKLLRFVLEGGRWEREEGGTRCLGVMIWSGAKNLR